MRTCLSLKAGAGKLYLVKDQIGNVFGFVGHTVSIAATSLCHYCMNTAIDGV